MDDSKNPFINNMMKYQGREVTVYLYTPEGRIIKLVGLCEGLDFKHKAIILRTDKETILIPRYLYITRVRLHPPENISAKITKIKY